MEVMITGEPTFEPVQVSEMKAHLNVTFDDDDDLIESTIKTARQHVERLTGRFLITQSGTAVFDSLPAKLVLPFAPVTDILEVRYTDTDGEEQILSSLTYRIRGLGKPWRPVILPLTGLSFPATECVPGAVEVDFEAGYGDLPDDVPQPLRQAVKMLAAHYYENREATYSGQYAMIATALGVADLLQDYREWSF